jgi:hypothetical protein
MHALVVACRISTVHGITDEPERKKCHPRPADHIVTSIIDNTRQCKCAWFDVIASAAANSIMSVLPETKEVS